MIEQNAKSALEVSDYGIVLQQGRLALAGSASDVLNHPEIGRLFLGGVTARHTARPSRTRITTATVRHERVRSIERGGGEVDTNGLIPTGTTALFTIIGSPGGSGRGPAHLQPALRRARPRRRARCLRSRSWCGRRVLRRRSVPLTTFGGGFVTIPHKSEAARHMDELTPRASALGVVNAVKHIDGRLVGDATDGTAFLAASRSLWLRPCRGAGRHDRRRCHGDRDRACLCRAGRRRARAERARPGAARSVARRRRVGCRLRHGSASTSIRSKASISSSTPHRLA